MGTHCQKRGKTHVAKSLHMIGWEVIEKMPRPITERRKQSQHNSGLLLTSLNLNNYLWCSMYYIVLKCVCTNVRSLFDSYFTERELFQYVNIPSLHSRLNWIPCTQLVVLCEREEWINLLRADMCLNLCLRILKVPENETLPNYCLSFGNNRCVWTQAQRNFPRKMINR